MLVTGTRDAGDALVPDGHHAALDEGWNEWITVIAVGTRLRHPLDMLLKFGEKRKL